MHIVCIYSRYAININIAECRSLIDYEGKARLYSEITRFPNPQNHIVMYSITTFSTPSPSKAILNIKPRSLLHAQNLVYFSVYPCSEETEHLAM